MLSLVRRHFGRLPRLAHVEQTRNTYVFTLRHAPPQRSEGEPQRPPDLDWLIKLDVVKTPEDIKLRPVKIILLQDVEGVGNQFDVLEIDSDTARDELILPKKAVYASPFDLEYYAAKKEEMREELESRIRIPYDALMLGRKLVDLLVPIHVSLKNKWTLDTKIISASLYELGVNLNPGVIHIPSENRFEGPNFEYEAKIIRFYIVANKQYVIPMVGRVSHISADEAEASLYPESLMKYTPEQLKNFGIAPEAPYWHLRPEIDECFDVPALMKSRRSQ